VVDQNAVRKRYRTPMTVICWTCQRPYTRPGHAISRQPACSIACRQQAKRLRLFDRLWAHVRQEGECWLWHGKVSNHGYAMLSIDRKTRNVHRFLYQHVRGQLPLTVALDHLCCRPACINPAHLEPVTTVVNILRGTSPPARNATKTHCPAGHAYTPDNTITRRQHRSCRACKRRRDAQRHDRWQHTHPRPAFVPVEQCYRGHAYDAGNTYWDTKGKRRCRACKRILDTARRRARGRPVRYVERTA